MSTKSQLQTAIQNTLTPPISKTEHVAAEVLVLDNLYPTPILCNNLPTGATNGILTPVAGVNVTIEYGLRFRKRGNTTFVEGAVTNKTNIFQTANLKLADINNPEFYQDVATGSQNNFIVGTNDLGIDITGSEVKLYTNSTGIAPNSTVRVKGFYHNPI